MFLQLAPVTKVTLGKQISARDIINLFHATTNVTALSLEFNVRHITDVLTALTLGGQSNEILLPELDTIWVQTFLPRGCGAFAIPALVNMAASRSPGNTGAYGVAPLREVLLDTAGDPTTLRVDLNAVLEQWSHKIDMPRITCDRLKKSSRYMVL